MNLELERLMAEGMNRYHTDARFHARVKLAVSVEEDLEGRSAPDRMARHERLERLVTVLHVLDQDENFRASVRYVGPEL